MASGKEKAQALGYLTVIPQTLEMMIHTKDIRSTRKFFENCYFYFHKKLDAGALGLLAKVSGRAGGRMMFRYIGLSLAAVVLTACAPQSIGSPPESTPSETVQVAQAAYSVGDYEEAARIYERAAARDNSSAGAYLGLGRSYTQLGQYNRAHNALMKAKSLSRRDPEITNELGNLALQQMQPLRAVEYFDESLGRDRRNLKALTGKAVALDFLSRHAEAQAIYRDALTIYPTNFALMSNYGLSQTLSGSLGSGIALMQELLRDPQSGDTVRSNLALAYMLSNRDADARAILQGLMSDVEIGETLNGYAQVRANYRAGKPVGYLVFG